MYICMYVCMYLCMYVCIIYMYVCMYACMLESVCVCVCVCVYFIVVPSLPYLSQVCGHYTYYGEWENNVRTGYGVLVHSNGRKEAGQWQKGRLISVLRKKKLTVAYLKGHGMEGKVNQARTLALQVGGEVME